ncbi:hypothetical protein PDESU_06152 [Pontiella desulfatans]|uniref:FecR protein domain-containing protein n=1 Tax=Pontiella desulfatans TaxID=2750659 RepID=A0A6C2UBX3_PONDE|nr:FecR family protein [Pontiella desulfatans]VGO17555.1 hypothetical protein PDESU_06152 [Pontiella desulfatans]
MNRPDHQETMDLIAEYYLRDLSAPELERLQGLLEQDADVRSQFVEAGRDEWLLHHVHHMEAGKIINLNTRKSRTRRIRAIAAAAAIVATLGTVFYAQKATISEMIASKPSAPAIAKVSDLFVLDGQAISVVNDGHVRKLNSASKIRNGDRLVIPPGCQLAFQYLEEETEVQLKGGSLVHVTDRNGAKMIHLDKGRLFAEVAKQSPGQPMRVSTRDAEVVVLGTAFEVYADAITRLAVTHGKVRFNSLVSDQSVVVGPGSFADSSDGSIEASPFRISHLLPKEDLSLNQEKDKSVIAVDPQRKYEGFVTFDLGQVTGPILEARLRLRVVGWKSDYGGDGDVRLFRVDPGLKGLGERVEVAHFNGRVGKGKDLELDLETRLLDPGLNAFVLALDRGGNDFWFSSSQGVAPPMLELKVAEVE